MPPPGRFRSTTPTSGGSSPACWTVSSSAAGPATALHWVGAQLDIDPARLGTHAHTTSGVDFVALATSLGELIEAHAAAVTGPSGDRAPT